MATTTCPGCRRSVTVPRINGAQPFQCPYCPRHQPPRVLYHCTACMGMSLLDPGARACPRCRTMLRPDARALLTPVRIRPVTSPNDWVFHTTDRKIAHSIKITGLRSTFVRTGSDRAHPQGAFARNRDARCSLPANNPGNPYVQIIKAGVMELRWAGLSFEEIEGLIRPGTPLAFVVTGGETDSGLLSDAKDRAFEALVEAVGTAKPKTSQFFKLRTDAKVKQLAERLLARRNHCLTALAIEYVTLYYRVEEVKTARHVYFLKNSKARDGYAAYTKGVSKSMIVVLRVHVLNAPGLHQDPSEEKAMCTLAQIQPRHIEVFTALNPDAFMDEFQRNDDRNWQCLLDWG